MKYPNTEYFPCYSPKLKEFLDEFGFEPIDSFTHLKTGKICWVYRRVEKLSPYLETWTRNKQKEESTRTAENTTE